ncbi:HIT family protein [Hypericibacter terrae]|jgi:diadenosine tetraphosphate (Ap4A) HIT family hydrolase|uniref:HIT family protein n=1 Tax=Hypericibacter terrae TaxID=2602015 RepID=A0A5J6MJZ1_9PROT|nr:HIT family protein [Hypericibacter terrae]QEX17902.1 HIT family protein [Hypericibacter terrae]
MTEDFALHQQLAADTVPIADWPLSSLRLMRAERRWPWLILVPRRAGTREIADLDTADRALLIEEIADATRLLQALFGPDKVNVAAIGNMVAQLHVHVVARFHDDPVWPKPIWGQLPAEPYEAAALETRLAQLRHALATGRHKG